ncbi:hypothetical protein A0H81_05850 [Grifola frondosa]|uniref:Uncharacterized protein n=1 Tax=Grifola frondosa TaxID=5627 RepID=A0A1C7MC72_GRIFR|nr:hypothetical protein A0H81_05850 [Grifola frondosa]
MPTTRPTRSQQQNLKSIYAESDSEEDTEPEQETPKPNARSLAKKRLSEIYTPDQDASFSSDGGRAPLNSENAQAGPSSEGANGEEEGAGENSRAAAQARQKQQLLSIAQAPVINVPLDVMSSNFEEWMKMATDNKINAANSWNLLLSTTSMTCAPPE